jgi:hypothetical protein
MSRWFRFYDCALDDPKVQKLPCELFKIWVNLLCVASRNDGILPALDDLSFMLRQSSDSLSDSLSELIRHGLIDESEQGLTPHNWSTRQYQSDNSAERVRKHREAKRHSNVSPVTECNVTRNDDVSYQNRYRADTDTDTEIISAPARSKKGTRLPENWQPKPDLIETATKAGLSASQFDTEIAKFRDYWQARAGSQGVKLDWDATARNWMRTAAERINPAPRNSPSQKTTPASAVWINRGSPQWQAWTKARGREPYVSVRNGDEGAYFRTEWPQAEGVAA